MKILILNGPNLSLLGRREPEIYGNQSFDDYLETLKSGFEEAELSYFQSNSEGDLVSALQEAALHYEAVILNAAAYTHTSIAIADAIRAMGIPVVEVHISNIFAREAYRQKSVISPYVRGVISGFGLKSYDLALKSLLDDTEI